MSNIFIQDPIDLPEQVSRRDFVLRLTEGVSRPEETLRSYVVTPQLTTCFDQALGLIKSSIEGNTSKAAYLHGSFGSGVARATPGEDGQEMDPTRSDIGDFRFGIGRSSSRSVSAVGNDPSPISNPQSAIPNPQCREDGCGRGMDPTRSEIGDFRFGISDLGLTDAVHGQRRLSAMTHPQSAIPNPQ